MDTIKFFDATWNVQRDVEIPRAQRSTYLQMPGVERLQYLDDLKKKTGGGASMVSSAPGDPRIPAPTSGLVGDPEPLADSLTLQAPDTKADWLS